MKRRLAATDFLAVVPLLSMTQERMEAARLYLVDGLSQRAIAAKYGVTPQAVSDAVSIVYRTWTKQQAGLAFSGQVPEGWVVATLAAPPDLMAKFRLEISDALQSKER